MRDANAAVGHSNSRAFEGRFRALLANISDMVTISDRDGGIIYVSPATEKVSGYTPEEYMARNPSDAIHPEDRPRCEEALTRLVGNPGLSLELEHRVRHRDGTWRWVEGTFTSLFDDPDVGGLLATVRDITERKRAEEALRESEERLHFALDAAEVGTFLWHVEEDRGEPDAQMLALFGLPADGTLTLAEALDTLIHPDDCAGYGEAVARATDPAGDGRLCKDIRVVHPDGSERWLAITAQTHFETGSRRAVRMSGMATDITERRGAEEKREQLRIREAAMRAETAERERISRELHDRVAHSMGVAHQSLQLHRALAESSPERAREKLAVAEETTKSALDQTRNLAIELRRSVAEETENGFATALRRVLETSVHDGVDAEFSFSGDESLVPHDVGAQVYLVMREAIRNALKHSGCERLEGSLEIEPGELVGTVTDDGNGFDPEAASGHGHRAGIGLRSMWERAELVGGALHLTSHPGGGTTIEIRVPLQH
jgi:PAS domain S-box-containing protein